MFQIVWGVEDVRLVVDAVGEAAGEGLGGGGLDVLELGASAWNVVGYKGKASQEPSAWAACQQ